MHTEATKSICRSKLIRWNYNKLRSQLDKKSEHLNLLFIFYFLFLHNIYGRAQAFLSKDLFRHNQTVQDALPNDEIYTQKDSNP